MSRLLQMMRAAGGGDVPAQTLPQPMDPLVQGGPHSTGGDVGMSGVPPWMSSPRDVMRQGFSQWTPDQAGTPGPLFGPGGLAARAGESPLGPMGSGGSAPLEGMAGAMEGSMTGMDRQMQQRRQLAQLLARSRDRR